MKLSSRRAAGALSAVALVGTMAYTGSAGIAAASAQAAACPQVTSTMPGISIVDPSCGFGPIANSTGQMSTVYTGILQDTPAGGLPVGGESAYRIEVPANWNRTLVMYAHGYRGTGNVVYVDNPELRQYFVDHGYAWAASSYAMNNYDVGTGVVDTHDLLEAFPTITNLKPTRSIMSGLSMGGAITAVETEYYRSTYAGAMPYCGVLGGNDLFNFFQGANVTAAGLTHTSISYPTTAAAGLAYASTYEELVQSELPKLGITPANSSGTFFSTDFTPTGKLWSDAVEQQSGGTRPGFASAISYWDSFGFAPLTRAPFLFGLYPGLTGGTLGFSQGNVVDNTHTVYTFGDEPLFKLGIERKLNASVLRVARTAPYDTNPTATEVPDVKGNPGIPVLSVHGIGDLFVPMSMDQDYNRLMIANNEGSLFVDRAIREVGHCHYTVPELASAFSALVNWINTGQRPAGDNILNPEAVESPSFGCRFTDRTPGAHPNFVGPPCPTGPGRGHNSGGDQGQA